MKYCWDCMHCRGLNCEKREKPNDLIEDCSPETCADYEEEKESEK